MEIQLNQKYTVKVIKIIKCGCIVELDDKSTQLIHLSQISNQFVRCPEEFVSVGDVFEALGVPGVKNPVELSLKHLGLTNPYADMRKQRAKRNDSPHTFTEANANKSNSLHTPHKSFDRTKFNKSNDNMRDYESKHDDYDDNAFNKRNNKSGASRNNANKSHNSAMYDYPTDKQRRKDKRSRDKRHRKDRYFD